MQENQYKIIFCDFDGTLVGADFKVLPEVAKQIQLWNDSGRFFSIATGKLFPGVIENTCRDLMLKTPQIISQGAAVVDPVQNKTLWAKFVALRVALPIIEALKKTNILFEINTFEGIFASSEKLSEQEKHKEYKFLDEFDSQNILKIRLVTTHNTSEEIERVKQTLEPLLSGLLLVPSDTPYSTGFDIVDENATKCNAVEFVTKYLGFSKNQTVGIGNGINDLELLDACDYRIATEDAPVKLKNAADFVTASYKEGGVGVAIQKLLKSTPDTQSLSQ